MSDETEIVRLNGGGGSSAKVTEVESRTLQLKPPTGVSIPGYEILEEIGRGGMGVVYKARQRSLNRLVALKVMIGGSFAGQTEKARFRMEAEALARLQHPNIVQVYDVGEYAGIAYIAVEFVDGPTIRRWQNGNPLEFRVAAALAATVARAVQHAHDMGIVHRDLKPANILLVLGSADKGTKSDLSLPTQTPKVGDFGLAKPLDGGAAITQSGAVCGTPNYMAPEQVQGGRAASLPAVDVWGLGAVLFELLTGRPPFVGPDASAVMQEIALLEPPTVRQFAPTVPRDLAVIVDKCLEKNPTRRYLSPGELAADLDRFLAGRPIVARPVGSIVRAGRWFRRNPVPAVLGMVLMVALVGVSAFAVALRQSAARERIAREGEHAALLEEARLRKKADNALLDAEDATGAAEKAGKDARTALERVEIALGQVRTEKDRAEKNLTLARQSVAHVLGSASRLSEGDDPALIPVYRNLLVGLEPFVTDIIAQKSGDRGLRLDQAVLARSLGLLESLGGRPTVSREYLLSATARLRELVKDQPDNPRYQFELGQTLAFAGSVSAELRAPDAGSLLAEASTILEKYLAGRPNDVEGLNELIRVRLSMNGPPGTHAYTDEHDRAVLDLVDRLAAIQGQTPHLVKTRAHALNNIASDLTNRGKTDEAESYWLQVLGLREGLFKTQPGDRITRYELGKCLFNYANQLAATQRGDEAFRTRERAAELFDALREDARYRMTYIPVMINTDVLLAGDYTRRKRPEKAIERLTNAISLNAVLLGRDRESPRHSAAHADAHVRRAAMEEQTGRHADAARDYKLAAEFSSDQRDRDTFTARQAVALFRAGELASAGPVALRVHPDRLPKPDQCVELARVWLAVAKGARDESGKKPEDRDRVVSDALTNARTCILAAEKKGWFRTADEVRLFHQQKDFEPIWNVFPREE